MSEPIFKLTNINYSYPGNFPALKDINLEIFKQEKVALIGANGTGKSTLLTLLDALIFAQSGEFSAFGKTITEKALDKAVNQLEFRKRVGFVFQNPDVQLFCQTVKEDILFGPLQLGIEKKIMLERFETIAEKLRIKHLIDRSPNRLSIGEKKKVAIASVLIIEPEVLILDEPTAGLDPQTTRDIIDALERENQAGKTIIMATHDLHIVEEIADLVHVFGGEKSIIRSGDVAEIMKDHDFLQKNNLMHVHVHRHIHKDN
ncbi:MAG: ABC transporter ATP-binding protein [Spirochaetales bacterium]|nr:ABC transporter ATP-binding protein [Spirochaetales bacterium]